MYNRSGLVPLPHGSNDSGVILTAVVVVCFTIVASATPALVPAYLTLVSALPALLHQEPPR
jgi:hypothetical protein